MSEVSSAPVAASTTTTPSSDPVLAAPTSSEPAHRAAATPTVAVAPATTPTTAAAAPTTASPPVAPAASTQPATATASVTTTGNPDASKKKLSAKESEAAINDQPLDADALAKAGNHACWSEKGEQTSFSDVIKPTGTDEKVVLIAIRHFHCGLCQDYVKALTRQISPEQLAAAKVRLVILGCGDWTLIKGYRELLKTHIPIYSEIAADIYKALGMTHRTLQREGNSDYAKTSVVKSIFGALKNTAKWGLKNAGDIQQLGGEFVFDKTGNTFAHRMRRTDDHLPVSELMKVAGIAPAPQTGTTEIPKLAPVAKPTGPVPAVTPSKPAPALLPTGVGAAALAPIAAAAATTSDSGIPVPTPTSGAAESAPIPTPTAKMMGTSAPAVVAGSHAAAPQPSEPELKPAAPTKAAPTASAA